jgi:hypothetical protein
VGSKEKMIQDNPKFQEMKGSIMVLKDGHGSKTWYGSMKMIMVPQILISKKISFSTWKKRYFPL